MSEDDACNLSFDRYIRKLRKAGFPKGFLEGLRADFKKDFAKNFQIGRQEGGAQMLLLQLRLKFGVLEPAIEERVRSANLDLLEEWVDRILTAESLQEVFRD